MDSSGLLFLSFFRPSFRRRPRAGFGELIIGMFLNQQPDKTVEDWLKKIREAEQRFWKEQYPQMTFEERVRHWADTLGKGLRAQQKGGLDPYEIFSAGWYESVRELEPDFDRIMDAVFETHWQGEWEREEYRKRINET